MLAENKPNIGHGHDTKNNIDSKDSSIKYVFSTFNIPATRGLDHIVIN